MAIFTDEKIVVDASIANNAFGDMGTVPMMNEIPGIPGFNQADCYEPSKEAKSGRIPSIFLIMRIADGQIFGAKYNQSADDNFYTDAPFYPGDVEFLPVKQKTRMIVEEYYDFS